MDPDQPASPSTLFSIEFISGLILVLKDFLYVGMFKNNEAKA